MCRQNIVEQFQNLFNMMEIFPMYFNFYRIKILYVPQLILILLIFFYYGVDTYLFKFSQTYWNNVQIFDE